ncbi:MAG: hypothetical protein J6K97_02040 [Clostridia bacterium]|nr:hypothetical protein [Clostridia bacterium]
MKNKTTKGLIKSSRLCTLTTFFSTLINIIGLAFIFTSFGMESQDVATQFQAFGIGAGLGIVGTAGTIISDAKSRKIDQEIARRKNDSSNENLTEEQETQRKQAIESLQETNRMIYGVEEEKE